LLHGTFTPSSAAASLSKAYHFNHEVPIIARLSNGTGLPQIPDNDSNANPRGFALRFNLPEKDGRRVHTDIVAHSVNGFPTRTAEEFLEFLRAAGASQTSTEKPSPIEKFLGAHPEAQAFLQLPNATPTSYANAAFFGVNAFKLISADGKETFVRYRFAPVAGVQTISPDEAKEKSANFLQDEIKERVAAGPILFKLNVQVAEEGDITDNSTVHWPESRNVVELGEIKLDRLDDDTLAHQKTIIFDPIPRVDGVDVSADPILDVRAAMYLIGGKERRAA
jgi:catalase